MTYKYPDAVLMIFCKAPVAGQVKTRLTTEFTTEQAVQVHIELTKKTLQLAVIAALSALNQENCCGLAPAEDGGYILIGLNQAHPELFNNIPWGAVRVLEHARARIKQHNLHHK